MGRPVRRLRRALPRHSLRPPQHGPVLNAARPFAHHLNAGHRYLAVISSAQREIACLENLYDQTLLSGASHISITITRRPEGPENVPPHERPLRFPHLYPHGAPGSDAGPESNDDHDHDGPLDDDRDDDHDHDDDPGKPSQNEEDPA